MDKGPVLSPALAGTREQIQQTRFLWAAVTALIFMYSAAIPLFLMAGLWLLPIVSLARFVDRVNGAGRKECHEKDTQSEQGPPTCHENILFDLAEAECTHMCVERCRSTRALAIGFDVRSNEVYEPVCFECGCPRRSSNSALASTAATPVSVRPITSSRPDRISMGPITPVFATPSPLPAPRPRVSPSPSSVPLLFLVTPPQQHSQPQNTTPEQPDHRPAAAYLGLLSPDEDQRPEALRSSLSTSISTSSSASASLFDSSSGADSAKIALLVMRDSSSSKARKDQVSSAPSSRRPSFGSPQPRQRTTHRTSSGNGAASTSGTCSLSGSHSVASESGISAAGVVGSDLGKPSYMRGTATSKAKLGNTRTHELSRLGCSVQLNSASSSVNRRALTAASFRLSAQY